MTEGPIVADFNASVGFAPDPQQELGLDMIFAVGPNGLPASFSFCVVCCRQNLKTGLFQQAAIGWLYVQELRKIVWSAHEMSSTLDAQKELGDRLQEAPALSRRLLQQKNHGIYTDNGSERIELATGQRIVFKARTRDGGRGLSGDKTVLDEAFALRPSHVGSLLPIMAARPHGQVLYGSSAGKADSDILRDITDRGRAGTSPRMSYLEWLAQFEECADPDCTHPKDAMVQGIDCALDREHLILSANPTITTGRISVQTIRDLRQELPPREYMRECYGWREEIDELAGVPAFDLRAWKALTDKSTPAPKRGCVVLDVALDRSRASIGLAGSAPKRRALVMTNTKPGMAWVVPTLVKLRSRVEVLEVALHPSGQAGSLIPALKKAGIEYVELTHKDVSRGCATAQLAVIEERLVHLGQPELDAAVAVARTRYVTEAEVWDRHNHKLEISPIVACAGALHRWDLLTAKPKTPPPSPRRARRTRASANTVAHAGF